MVFNNLFFYFIDFDGYYIVRTVEGQPRPKYIFNKMRNYHLLYLLNGGLVHHHQLILNLSIYLSICLSRDVASRLDSTWKGFAGGLDERTTVLALSVLFHQKAETVSF